VYKRIKDRPESAVFYSLIPLFLAWKQLCLLIVYHGFSILSILFGKFFYFFADFFSDFQKREIFAPNGKKVSGQTVNFDGCSKKLLLFRAECIIMKASEPKEVAI
jgi:hypothetical protein